MMSLLDLREKYGGVDKHGHEWEAAVGSRVRGSQCPYCSGRVVIPGETDLVSTHPSVAAG